MSEAKFTKGEWKVEGSSMSMGANYRGTFYVTSNCFDGDIFEASKANTNLIAAAPRMYEEIEADIKNLKSLLMGVDPSSLESAAIEKKIHRKQKLLAKARGEHD